MNARIAITTAIAALLVLVQPVAVRRPTSRCWSANGMREVLQELGPRFERETGHGLTIFCHLGSDRATRPGRRDRRCDHSSAAGHRSTGQEGRARAGTVAVLARAGISSGAQRFGEAWTSRPGVEACATGREVRHLSRSGCRRNERRSFCQGAGAPGHCGGDEVEDNFMPMPEQQER